MAKKRHFPLSVVKRHVEDGESVAALAREFDTNAMTMKRFIFDNGGVTRRQGAHLKTMNKKAEA